MAYNVTFSDLQTSVLDQADEQGYGYVGTTELQRIINRSYARLYARLVKAAEDDYTITTTITTVAGQAAYSLPSGFLVLRHLEADLGGIKPARLRKFMLQEHHQLAGAWSPGQVIAYRPIGADSVTFLPTPSAAHDVTVWYIPAPTVMTGGSDMVDMRSGWDDWIVYDAAAKIGLKQEQDIGALIALRDDVWRSEIAPLISAQDEADPEKVQDVEGDFYLDDGSW